MTDAPWPVFRPTRLLRRLVECGVDLVVIGGVAVIAQASRILTLSTVDGDIDLLVEPSCCPPYEILKANADRIEVEELPVLVASVDDLIAMKRAAGRPRDLIDLEALEIARSQPD
jgi:hypothetical protein